MARLSLRDPAGDLFEANGRLVRSVHPNFFPTLDRVLKSPTIHELVDGQAVISSHVIPEKEATQFRETISEEMRIGEVATFLEHPRIPFVSYPQEWSAPMLYEAAKLTLDLADRLLEEGLGLKDATPRNVLFKGPQPVFIDILSIEERHPGDSAWLPFGQFVRTFLNPLLAHKYFGVGLHSIFTTHNDGMEPEEVYALCSWWQRLRNPFLPLVTIPTWLSRSKKHGTHAPNFRIQNTEKAQFIVKMLFKALRKRLEQLSPIDKKSTWSDYSDNKPSYSIESEQHKINLIQEMLSTAAPKRVLDIGCNQGQFSLLAAKAGASVIGIDFDAQVIAKAWVKARTEKADFLPLVVDIANPTPATGWCNRETKTFLQRSEGQFDCVLALAVLHHLTMKNRIPASEVIDLIARLTTQYSIIEFVGPEDAMVRGLNQSPNCPVLTQDEFEKLVSKHFSIVRKNPVTNSERCLYLLQRN